MHSFGRSGSICMDLFTFRYSNGIRIVLEIARGGSRNFERGGGGAPIMKNDNEVRNGRVHRKGVGAGGGHSPSHAKRGRFLLLYVQNAI